MLIADLSAVRPGDTLADVSGSAPVLGAAPPPMVPLGGRDRARLRAGPGVLALALGGNLLAILFLVLMWQASPPVETPPEGVEVELASSVPGEPPPSPKPEKKTEPETKPEPEKTPEPKAAEAPRPPASPADPEPPATPSATETLNQALKPALVEPPPEPKAAATQSDTNQLGNRSADQDGAKQAPTGTPDAKPTEAKPAPPPAPPILTAGQGSDGVSAAPPKPADPAPPAPGDATSTPESATARLSAALATASVPMPMSFRAALSARGTSDDSDYRGSVFGALARARQAVNDEAQARRLKGQVVLAVVLTATGAIEKVSVVQSSGHRDADAFAVEMVRRAAPFPPPPPGASHTFTPAITFGEG